ncbi:VanZ family protein [Aestuariibacter sp. AA17]|uniref:VanZ family protein n=1 Tax=Fluctibacter corallii TaxID=2984329 RepID=A0ABT3AD27_9ALTE|nr:VanZ family protein [Aestuariibacter sp. AA17]MCV2886579.1 VanZ family protein [Aestuariibacter sp. AA17]
MATNKANILIFVLSVTVYFILMVVRKELNTDDEALALILGSFPSFLVTFGFLSILPSLTSGKQSLMSNYILFVLFAVGYEVSQLFVRGTFDTADVIATIVGGALGIGAILIFNKKRILPNATSKL